MNNIHPLVRQVLVLCAALGAVALLGCAKHNPIVGKWSGNVAGPMGMTAQLEVEFRGDGTQSQTLTAMGRAVSADTKYTAADGTLTETYPPGDAPAFLRPKGGGDTAKYKYAISGDTLTLTQSGGGAAIVLHRE